MHVMVRVYAHELARQKERREREGKREREKEGIVSIPGVEGNISIRNCRSMRRNRNSVERYYYRGKHGNCGKALIKNHPFDGYFTLEIDPRYSALRSSFIGRNYSLTMYELLPR